MSWLAHHLPQNNGTVIVMFGVVVLCGFAGIYALGVYVGDIFNDRKK